MKCIAFLSLAVLLSGLVFTSPSEAATILWSPPQRATILWGNSGLALDRCGYPLWGTTEFGPEPDLSLGALVQLWKAVGDVDDPRMIVPAYESTDWSVDDILLGESHMGYGTFGDPNGSWAHIGDYAVSEGDILYARVYNLSKPQWLSAPRSDRGIAIRNDLDSIVTQTVGSVMNPQTLHFDNLRLQDGRCVPVPEPGAALLVLPGLAVWVMKKRQ